MIKTHKITGLKYLCQTHRNPFKYCGSGIDWVQHLKDFGKDHHTEIILQTISKDERNYWGIYYSKLWNVTNAQDDFGNKIWANRVPENGGGGGTITDPIIIEHVANSRREKMKRFGDDHWSKTEEFKNNMRGELNSMRDSLLKQKCQQNGGGFKSGSSNCNYDHIIYEFYNTKTKEVFVGTRNDFIKKYCLHKGHVGNLISKKQKSHMNWVLTYSEK